MTTQPALDIVLAYQDAWVGRDFQTAAGYVADDVVFVSPGQHITSSTEFMAMLSAFAQRIETRWEKIAAFGDETTALLMYNLFTLDGTAIPCADCFIVRDGQIHNEQLIFDSRPFAPPPGATPG